MNEKFVKPYNGNAILKGRDVDVDVIVTLKLIYDNDEVKVYQIRTGDIIEFKYRYRGDILSDMGKITQLRLTDKDLMYGVINGFDITVDASNEYESKLININSNDIMDITMLISTEDDSIRENMTIDADSVFIRLQENIILSEEDYEEE